jgi:hypothetical protein
MIRHLQNFNQQTLDFTMFAEMVETLSHELQPPEVAKPFKDWRALIGAYIHQW